MGFHLFTRGVAEGYGRAKSWVTAATSDGRRPTAGMGKGPTFDGRQPTAGKRLATFDCRLSVVGGLSAVGCRMSASLSASLSAAVAASPLPRAIISSSTFSSRCNSDRPGSSKTGCRRLRLFSRRSCASGLRTSGTSARRLRQSRHRAPPGAPSSNAR